MDKSIGAIYYTDFHADPKILHVCQDQIRTSFDGEIVSVTLNKPLDLGRNIVLEAERGYPTLVRQIILALESIDTRYVFFMESDVLYHRSHFDFVPTSDDIYYYSTSVYRWDYPNDRLFTHDRLLSLSGLCCNRELALSTFRFRLKKMEEAGLANYTSEHGFMRRMGYEPGTKFLRGNLGERHEEWRSEFPNIDIRHNKNFSRRKCKITEYQHQPSGWKDATLETMSGWDVQFLKGLIH